MTYLLLAVCVAAGLLLIARWFVTATPREIKRALQVGLIGIPVLLLLFVVFFRRPSFLWGLPIILPLGWLWRRRQQPSTSDVETANLKATLDHGSGRLTGTVRQGQWAGRTLDDLAQADLVALYLEWAASDGQSASVLEAYLDRRFGNTWRPEPAAADSAPPPRSDRMTRPEALEVLGLAQDASDEDIRAAHRRLMKQFHPDHGGSDYIAAKINQAKDILLGT